MPERILYNLLQVAVVIGFAPLAEGVMTRLKENLQSKRGPSIFQPYRDLWKLLHKDEIVSDHASWIFRAAPYVAFVAPVFVTLLIPVLTRYPLEFAFMGDMLGGGFVLALGGFFTTLAAVDTGNPYGPMGASRTRMVGFLAEPVFIVVFLTVSFVAGSTIPYIVQTRWETPIANFFEPSHILLLLAFLMLILAEDGRIPVDSPPGQFELAMIDRSKGLEVLGTWRGADQVGRRDEVFRSDDDIPECPGHALGPGGNHRPDRRPARDPQRAAKNVPAHSGPRLHRILAGQAAAVPDHRIPRRGLRHLRGGDDHAAVGDIGRPACRAPALPSSPPWTH